MLPEDTSQRIQTQDNISSEQLSIESDRRQINKTDSEGSPYSPNGPVAEKPHEHRAKKLSAHETRINSMVS
jgi:hypothetical protein